METTERIDSSLLLAAGCMAGLTALGALYAWPWSKCGRSREDYTEYNSVWGVRLCLGLVAIFWLLTPFLQLHEVWTPTANIRSALGIAGYVPCQVYLAARFGLLEPFFLFLALHAFKYSLRQGKGWENLNMAEFGRAPTPLKNSNKKIIGKALANTLPILSIQTVLSFVPMMLYENAGKQTDPPPMLLIPYFQQMDGCVDSGSEIQPSDRCIMCVYPIVSTLVSGIFILYYASCLWKITSKMMQITVNQTLMKRMIAFRAFVTVLLLLGVACRCLTVWLEPPTVLFEVLRLGDFASVALFVTAANYSLVLRPVCEARFAEKINRSESKWWREVDLTDSLKSLGRV